MAGSPPKDAEEVKEAHSAKEVRTGDHVVVEADAGKADLAHKSRLMRDALKAGARSGITNEFGKPVFTDGKHNGEKGEHSKTVAAGDHQHPASKEKHSDAHVASKGDHEAKRMTKTGEIRSYYATARAANSEDRKPEHPSKPDVGNFRAPERTQLSAYEEWHLNLKPGHSVKSPDGATVHADQQGRIDWITDVKDQKTTIQYEGNSTQPSSIKIADGPTLTWHGKAYGIAGQEGQVDAVLDQNTGILRWTNKFHEETRHFPGGGISNEDQDGRVTSVTNAYGQRTEFQYDDKHHFPVHIKAGFDTGKPITEFVLAGDGKTPTYYYEGNADFGGGTRIGIAADRHTGSIYTLSLPTNVDITNYQEMNTLKVHKANGQTQTLFDGDLNFIPEPLRILMGAKKL